eukprot:TRINITY_DN936_c0_g1_i9.p2 TRINITY_DN936_c0_g1~~TRINITY_DN936_c0_g1_i9.p2  ORF type:complete len:114 (+),score=15.16 TRINITY_DN936_c0_g1_i9:697-1038(+)
MNSKKYSWRERASVRDYLNSVKVNLEVYSTDDWYHTSSRQICSLPGGTSFLSAFGRLHNGLQFAFPEICWESDKFMNGRKKSAQRFLGLLLRKIFNQIQEHWIVPEVRLKTLE